MHILMLGNSLTTANDLPQLIRNLAAAHQGGETELQPTVHARGGARLAEHLNPSTKLGAATQEAPQNQRWDFVILQEMSHAPASMSVAYARSAAVLCEQIRKAGATPVIYATWAYAPGCPKLDKLGMTSQEMHQLMHRSFVDVAAAGNAILADAGTAFAQEGELSLYAADGVHPNPKGSALAARIIAQACGLA